MLYTHKCVCVCVYIYTYMYMGAALFFLFCFQKWQLDFLVSLYLFGPEFAQVAHARSYF